MLNFAICDDEPVMVKEILEQLSEYMSERNRTPYKVKSFLSGRALLESSCNFDVIFLDIQMEQPDGMETARRLRKQKNDSLHVYAGVNDVIMDYAVKEFQRRYPEISVEYEGRKIIEDTDEHYGYNQQLSAQLMSGSGADIFFL